MLLSESAPRVEAEEYYYTNDDPEQALLWIKNV